MSAKERLKEFVKYKGIGRNRFEELVGISSGYISSKSPSVGSEIIEKIVYIYHDLNIEWLVTGRGQMIKDPYGQKIGTAEEFAYKSTVYVPLVSRHAQAQYIHRLDDKLYINTLPVFPVTVEYGKKGNYVCFEMWDESMDDGTGNSYKPGDILICRETDRAFRQTNLYFNKPKSFVVIHENNGIIAAQITAHDPVKQSIRVHLLNPSRADAVLDLRNVKKLFDVLKLHRTIND